MEPKKEEKFTLIFDKAPKIMFISDDGKPFNSKLLIDGEEIKGIRQLTIRSDAEDGIVTHEIECITALCGK